MAATKQQQTEWEIGPYGDPDEDGKVTVSVSGEGDTATVRVTWFSSCGAVTFKLDDLEAWMAELEYIRPYPDVWLDTSDSYGKRFMCSIAWGDEFKAGSTAFRADHKSVPFEPFMKALKGALGKPRWKPKKPPAYQATLLTRD